MNCYNSLKIKKICRRITIFLLWLSLVWTVTTIISLIFHYRYLSKAIYTNGIIEEINEYYDKDRELFYAVWIGFDDQDGVHQVRRTWLNPKHDSSLYQVGLEKAIIYHPEGKFVLENDFTSKWFFAICSFGLLIFTLISIGVIRILNLALCKKDCISPD